jgi:hypothetical protein
VTERLGDTRMLKPLIKVMLPIWKKCGHSNYVSYLTELLIRMILNIQPISYGSLS